MKKSAQKSKTSEGKILTKENDRVNVENGQNNGLLNNKDVRNFLFVEILLGIAFLIIGFTDTDRFGSIFFIIFSIIIIAVGGISFACHPRMISKYFSFIGLGICIFFVIVWAFGFLVKDINPAFRPFSEEVSLHSLGWNAGQTQTKYVLQTENIKLSTESGIELTATGTQTPTLTQTSTQTPTLTSTFTQTPSPTATPTRFLGFLFCVKDTYLWAIPINQYPRTGTQIGVILPKECVRFDGITADGKWLRVFMDQPNITRHPNASEWGFVTSDGLSDKEINRNALPIIESIPYPY